MKGLPQFESGIVKSVAEPLGDAITGRRIGELLAECGIADPGEMTKRDRISRALLDEQSRSGSGDCLITFAKAVLQPFRWTSDPARFQSTRRQVNSVLKFCGIEIGSDGTAKPCEIAQTLDEIPETVPLVEVPDGITAPLIDVVIITAIKVEREAICKALGLTHKHRERCGVRTYWRRRLELPNGQFYEVVVAQLLDAGNVDASLLTSDAIHHWQPEALLMVGIAAAARPKQVLGDVVVAQTVRYFERGKDTPTGKDPEPTSYRVDATLLDRARAAPDWEDPIPVPRPDGTGARPEVHFGVVAAGERVIASGAVRDEIASPDRRILAIDMEDYGVSAAVWQQFERVRHLIIRGLCDHADSRKSDKWHPYAAAAAAGFTKHILLDCPLEPRNVPG